MNPKYFYGQGSSFKNNNKDIHLTKYTEKILSKKELPRVGPMKNLSKINQTK